MSGGGDSSSSERRVPPGGESRDPLTALGSPTDWRWAAPALAARGDPAVLPALVAAYEIEVELSHVPLLEAMQALGGRQKVSELADSQDREERMLAARLARLLPDPSQLRALEQLANDADPQVAAAARSALQVQLQTPEWQAVVTRLGAGAA